MFKLSDKTKAFQPLVRVFETFPEENQVVCTVKGLKPDLSELVVNVNHLISLELYIKFDNLIFILIV